MIVKSTHSLLHSIHEIILIMLSIPIYKISNNKFIFSNVIHFILINVVLLLFNIYGFIFVNISTTKYKTL